MPGEYLSMDPNAGLGEDEYLSLDPNAGDTAAPMPQSGASIRPYNPGIIDRAKDAALNMEGVPGILVGAATRGINSVAQLGDLARAGWNMLAPESLEVERPSQQIEDIPAMNPWQQVGQRGVQAAEWGVPAKAAVTKGPGIIARGLRISKERAGANMQGALDAGKDLRVSLTPGVQEAAMRAYDVSGAGRTLPPSLNKFLNRLTSPKVTGYRGDDLATREAQDFVSSFTSLSADDMAKMAPEMRSQLTKLAIELRAALTDTLDAVGKGDQYARGVAEYRRAAKVAERWEQAKPWLRRLGYAAAAGAGYRGVSE